MPNELQDALDRLDRLESQTGMWPGAITEPIVDAARRVANGIPTYLIYTRQDVFHLGHIYQGDEAEHMAANPNLPGKWFTALDITENTDG